MTDEEGIKDTPLPTGELLHEVKFNVLRIVVRREAEALRQANDVRIAGNALALPERCGENDHRGLPPNTRELEQSLHCLGHFPVEPRDEEPTHLLYVLRLRTVETARTYIPF